MKLVRVVWELRYAGNDEQKAQRAEEEASILAFLGSANAREDKTIGYAHGVGAKAHFMDSETALEFISTFGTYDHYKGGVKSMETMCDSLGTFERRMGQLMDRMERMAMSMDYRDSSDINDEMKVFAAGWNGHTNSPVPGFNLGMVNDLNLMQDCCTDALQGMLDDGWRLIAVCPQESRRPDYILGRWVAMPRNAGRALRGG